MPLWFANHVQGEPIMTFRNSPVFVILEKRDREPTAPFIKNIFQFSATFCNFIVLNPNT